MIILRYIMVASFKALADENGGKHRKNKCLDKSNQYFNEVIKYNEQYGKRRKSKTGNFTHFAKNKNERNESQDNNMTRHHIRKKTNNQSARFNYK